MASQELHRLGREVLGPAFATFAHLLLERAAQQGITRLAFVARDGDFLRDVTRIFADSSNTTSVPTLDYLYMSRASSMCLQYDSFQDALEGEANEIFGARHADVGALLRYVGLDPETLAPLLAAHQLATSTPASSLRTARDLFRQPALLEALDTWLADQRRLVEAYLHSSGLLNDSNAAMVDLGWRGSIPDALNRAQRTSSAQILSTFYLGYWDDRRPFRTVTGEIEGIVGDIRRGRNVVEGSVFYIAYLLEAICRAPHGTVLRFHLDSGGVVKPVLATGTNHREIEIAGERWREPIREGIREFVSTNAARYRVMAPSSARRDAQRRLFRLAFFPTRAEIAAVEELSHTEGHAPSWSTPLLHAQRPSPYRSPRAWLSGLASPWRSGYVKATGGVPFALAYVVAESILLTFPRLRHGLRRTALVIAGRTGRA
jgi:hypothetical protein